MQAEKSIQPNELEILIDHRHAVTLRVAGDRAEEVELKERWKDVSIAWGEPPDKLRVELWLDACLPENGSREPYGACATTRLVEQGLVAKPWDPVSLIWANPDTEYPGAVSFRSICTTEQAPEYHALGNAEIGDRIYEAWAIANKAHKGRPMERPERRTSLSGMRGKIGLAWRNEQWHAAYGTALTDWIAKHEDSKRLRGEAGIESLCQKAMELLNVPAARTLSRTFGDHQCVLSERADRVNDPIAGIVAIHQEDFAQATAWPGGQKYDSGTKAEPRWEAAYALLRAHGTDPRAEIEKLTRMLAATWMLGHGDLHRRNLGFTHATVDGSRRIRLAPMYDVSSGVGTYLDQELAIGIARQVRLSGIGPRQWLAHAHQCDLDPERTLAIVRETVRDAPEAIAAAREAVREHDENRFQSSVDRRAEELVRYAEKRKRVFEEQEAQRLKKMAKKNAPLPAAPHRESAEPRPQPRRRSDPLRRRRGAR